MHSPIFVGILSFLVLLGCACAVFPLTKKLKLPFSVGLLLTGMGLAYLSQFLGGDYSIAFTFEPELLFYLFLPTLIFESAYHLHFRDLKNVFREVVVLAALGLIIGISIVAYGSYYLLGIPWEVALIFAVIIAPTDPAAVLAIFKDIKVPRKLQTMIEGESLINDGTALIFFQILKGGVLGAGFTLSSGFIATEAGNLLLVIAGSVSMGAALGYIFMQSISSASNRGVQVALSFIMAHATFLLAEGVFHISGVIATMTAGMILGNAGFVRMNSKSRFIFDEIWNFMGFISNSLVFLLLGAKITEVPVWENLSLILSTLLLLIFIARPLSVVISLGLTNLTRKPQRKIPLKHQSIVAWSGLRGALSAAMVLLLPDAPDRDLLLLLVGGSIIGSFFFNATTLRYLLHMLKMDCLSFTEKIQQLEATILIDERVRQHLKRLKHKKHISPEAYSAVEKKYRVHEEKVAKKLTKIQNQLSEKGEREIEKVLTYHALTIELKEYKNLFEHHEISRNRYSALQESIWRQIERLEQDELPHERKSKPKIAPKIPHEANFSKEFFFGLPHKWWMKRTKYKIIQRLQHYRARALSGRVVIAELKKLKTNTLLQSESALIQNIITRYELWILNANRKIKTLQKEHSVLIQKAENHLAEYLCYLKEHECEQDFLEKGFISEKVFDEYEKRLDKKMKRKCKELF